MESDTLFLLTLLFIAVYFAICFKLSCILNEITQSDRCYTFWAFVFTPVAAILLAILDKMESNTYEESEGYDAE